MVALVDCLRDLISRNENPEPPTLVLGGDVLEFALATDNVAAMVFDRFVELTMAGPDRLFDRTVYFVPGNHDHHLWEGAREKHYAEYVAQVPLGQPLKAPRHTTPMFPGQDEYPTEAQLLSALIQRVGGAPDLHVQMAYPNLALVSDDGQRGLVFHHGHYVESMYRLMSVLNQTMFRHSTEPEVAQWEAENFAWIDFFWSALGRSGDVGLDIALTYESLQSPAATDKIIDRLSDGVAQLIPRGRVRRSVARRATGMVLRHAAANYAGRERRHVDGVLSQNAREGLREYIDGPLRNQLVTDCNGDPPSELTFAFGHTHKPFLDVLDAPRYPTPVVLMNTGGWVVDGLEPEPYHGAGAVLVDEHLDVLNLRFYAQSPDPSTYRTIVEVPPGKEDRGFTRRMREIVEADRDPWRHFSKTVADIVPQRNADLAVLIGAKPPDDA